MGIQKLVPVTGGRTALSTYSEAVVQQAGAVGAVNLDLAQANDFVVVAGAGDVAIGFANPPAAGIAVPIRIRMVQDGAGGRIFTFPASVLWPLGQTPLMPLTANAAATVELVTFDGGVTYIVTSLTGDAGGKLHPAAGIFGTGTDYAPQWTGNSNPIVPGNAVLVGRHFDIGNLCVVKIALTIGSGTAIPANAGIWRFTLPHPVAATDWRGQARFYRASGLSPDGILGDLVPVGGNVCWVNLEDAVAGDVDTLVNNTAGGRVVATGDQLLLGATFERA